MLVAAAASAQWGREPDPAQAGRYSRASVVFASHDLSSPASLFGHTFLVLHDQALPEADALVIEFGGVATRLSDQVDALVGSIPGRFSASYFSYKQREYFELGRSLWVYPLRLSPEALSRLKQQVRSVVGREQPYTFLRNNCSHYILALVAEAAGIDPIDLGGPFVVPVDTLRFLQQQALLAAPVQQSAPKARAEAAFAALSQSDRARFVSFQRDPDQPTTEPADSALALALSAAAEHWVLQEWQASRRDAWYRLKRRFPVSAELDKPSTDPLATGAHSTWSHVRGLGGAASTLGWSYGFLSFKGEDLGGLSNAELQLLDMAWSHKSGRARLERLEVLSMEANRPASPLGAGFTQRLDIAYGHDADLDGARSERLLLRFGRGLTRRLGRADVTTLPFVAAGAVQGGAGWKPALTLGLRGAMHLTLPAGWRAKASLDWHGRELARWRSQQRLEIAAPTVRGRHGFGLQLAVRNAERQQLELGLRWSYRSGPWPGAAGP